VEKNDCDLLLCQTSKHVVENFWGEEQLPSCSPGLMQDCVFTPKINVALFIWLSGALQTREELCLRKVYDVTAFEVGRG